MSLLFKERQTGAATIQRGAVQRFVMAMIHHIRQAIGSLGELWRTPAASLMTIGVLGISLTLPTTLHLIVKNMSTISNSWDSAAEITLFLKQDISTKQRAGLIQRVSLFKEVESVDFISKEQGLQDFQRLSGFGPALNALNNNPLPDVLLVVPQIKHRTPEQAKILLTKLQKQREVEFGKLDIDWLERLNAIVNLLKQSVFSIAVLLLAAVLLIIGNTIRLNIMNKKEEIEVMKLVGATESFIRWPFLYTGAWYGLFGGVLAFLCVTGLIVWLDGAISRVAGLYDSDFSLNHLTFTELGTLLLVSVILGLVGSWLSVNRYVAQIEPD
ncbi:permease-like cell division protein FtsX [Flocculibacter collagenilyticus]|uniref:permease-like cell division protein FtsX n=1 Tax=Flocculibacter collagenilyticus TaxID=2744479 RepID=UPI0018F78E74|nr:permease-like cell division protein FtsX [Flocculibacter collagenilyticus]